MKICAETLIFFKHSERKKYELYFHQFVCLTFIQEKGLQCSHFHDVFNSQSYVYNTVHYLFYFRFIQINCQYVKHISVQLHLSKISFSFHKAIFVWFTTVYDNFTLSDNVYVQCKYKLSRFIQGNYRFESCFNKEKCVNFRPLICHPTWAQGAIEMTLVCPFVHYSVHPAV